MDTFIGVFDLTENQIANMSTISVVPFKGGSYNMDTKRYVAVSETEPTQQQKESLASAINSLSETLDRTVYEAGFNVDLMTKRIGDVIDDLREIALLPYLGGVQSSAKAKNWVKLKNLINGLVQANIATSNEAALIKGVILEQGINIDSY